MSALRSWRIGVYRLADPKVTLASVASMIVGATAAAARGPIDRGWLAMTIAGVFFVEAAKNASGEVFDWDSGTDIAVTDDERTPFSGGKRVIVDGLMTRRQAVATAGVFYFCAGLVGCTIALLREPWVMALGGVGVGLAYFYHAPPIRMCYRGFGELAVAVAYGPVIACGTYLVQRRGLGTEVLWASLPLGLAIMAFLWINEFPDARADAAACKRTWVVRLGPGRAATGFAAIVAIAWAGVAVLPLLGLPRAVWAAFAGAPFGVAAALRLRRHRRQPRRLVAAQVWTLLSFLLMAIGTGIGFLWYRIGA